MTENELEKGRELCLGGVDGDLTVTKLHNSKSSNI